MRFCKQWHRPISERLIKPPYSISRAAPIDSDCCRLPTTSVLSNKADKLRSKQLFDQQVQVSQGHLFDLIAIIPLSLLLYFIPLSLSLLCLPIWAVLYHLYMYIWLPFLPYAYYMWLPWFVFVFVPWFFPLLNPSLAKMSSAGYFHARFLLSAFFSFLFFSFPTVFAPNLFWCNFLYLVTTAGFVADQLIM